MEHAIYYWGDNEICLIKSIKILFQQIPYMKSQFWFEKIFHSVFSVYRVFQFYCIGINFSFHQMEFYEFVWKYVTHVPKTEHRSLWSFIVIFKKKLWIRWLVLFRPKRCCQIVQSFVEIANSYLTINNKKTYNTYRSKCYKEKTFFV